MFLQNHIEKLRQKPDHVRRQVAFWYAFGITAVIFAFWLASFTPAATMAKGTVSRAVEKAGSPAQSLIAGVGGFFGDIKNIIFGPSKITYSEVEVSAGRR